MTIKKIVNVVERDIIGRVANKIGDQRMNNLEMLLKYAELSGNGNYLEIGTLFGGSAIPVAILKDILTLDGFVFCVDPLNGYYSKIAPRDDMIDTQSGVPVTPKTLFQNINKFKVENRVFVMSSYSSDIWSFFDLKFSLVYIDGDHRGDQPYQDWLKVKDNATKYVLFDNYAPTHPDVQRACEKASSDPEWECIEISGITYVLERISGNSCHC